MRIYYYEAVTVTKMADEILSELSNIWTSVIIIGLLFCYLSENVYFVVGRHPFCNRFDYRLEKFNRLQ